MQIKITNEQPFQVLGTNFTIGPSSSGYDLMFSADGLEYSKLFTVGANTNRQVTQVAAGSYYFLSGNTDTVTVNWMKDCGGGSGGGSYVLPVASENTLGGVKIGSGLTMSGDTLNANPGGYTLPMASDAVLGGVKIGSGITIDANGVISADVQSGGAQEAKTIVLKNMSPADFSEDDIDAMQEMVDYLAEFPVDNLPAARISIGGNYHILGRLDYSPEDTENDTPEERYVYQFNYAAAYGDEGMDESQIGYIQTFYLNAKNVEESYNMYWDSSESGAKKLSAVEDLSELGALNGDVAALSTPNEDALPYGITEKEIDDAGEQQDKHGLKIDVPLDMEETGMEDPVFLGNAIVDDTYTYGIYVYRDSESGIVFALSSDGDMSDTDYAIFTGDEGTNNTGLGITVYFESNAEYNTYHVYETDGSGVSFSDLPEGTQGEMGLYQYNGEEGEWKPLAKSIVINDYLDGGQDKVAEFYAMMKPYMGDSPKGWPFNLYYRTKYFDMNPTLATLTTAWMSDYQSFGMENLYFMFEYVGYAHDFDNSQAPDRRLIEVAEDGSYDSNYWGGKSPSDLRAGYVRFGNDSRGGLTYDADNDRFKYDSQYIATGDTTTVYDDLIDNRMTDNLFENAPIDGNLACLDINLLYVVESGETKEYSQPLLSRKTFSTPVTIDNRDFYKEITYNYGDWKLTALYGADDGNNAANLRITALP